MYTNLIQYFHKRCVYAVVSLQFVSLTWIESIITLAALLGLSSVAQDSQNWFEGQRLWRKLTKLLTESRF